MSVQRELLFIVLYAVVTILSFILCLVTLLSYRKYRNPKLLFVSGVFAVFLIRGALLSASVFSEDLADVVTSGYLWFFDVLILVLLYVSYSLKR